MINELAEEYFFHIWWDEIQQLIILKAIVPPTAGVAIPNLNDDEHLIKDKTVLTRNIDRRLSRVLFYYNPRSPIDVSDPEDYESAHVILDADSESDAEYGDIRHKVIYGRFVDSEAIAVQTAGRMLSRFINSPQDLTIRLDAKDAGIWTGDLANVETRQIQDNTGANQQKQFQVMSVREKVHGSIYEYKLLELNFAGRFAFIGPDTLTTYDLESDANIAAYAFISDDAGSMSDMEPGYNII